MNNSPRNLPELAALLRAEGPRLRDITHEHLYSQVWEARQSFPFRMDATHVDLAPALAWVFERTPMSGTLQSATRRRLAELGRSHRRHGFPAHVYPMFAASLEAGLEIFDLTPRVHAAAVKTIKAVCDTMAHAAAEADQQGVPPAHSGEVVAVEHPNRFTTVVKLETGMPVDYAAGDALPVTCDLLPGKWVLLTPAVPSDDFGQLEFHIHNCGDNSHLLSTTRVGDRWIMGNPRPGFLPDAADTDRVIIAFGTGWAAAKAWLLELVNSTTAQGHQEPPAATCVYVVADSPGLLYDTEFQTNLDTLAPWLNLQHIIRRADDDRWLRAQPLSATTHPLVSDDPIATVVDDGPWFEFDMVLVGAPKDVKAGADQLREVGFPAADIQAYPWAIPEQWPKL